jgi:uncharacterized membrane protein
MASNASTPRISGASFNMLNSLIHWLGDSPASHFISDVLWIIPLVQVLHILAVAAVMSSVGMLALRIFGLAGVQSPVAASARRFLPWIWVALAVLAISGTILITGEPGRTLNNPAFWLKMSLLVPAIVVTALFQRSVKRNPAIWTDGSASTLAIRGLTTLTLLVWLAIPVAGRWIAYMIQDTN